MIYLGIDGGGSKTTFLLTDDHDRELFRTQSGPSNWVSVGKDAASAAIREGIENLPASPGIVCGGFAGAGRSEGAAFYKSVIEAALPSARISIVSDAVVAYVGALGAEPGVLLIGGTGSIAIGRMPDGTMVRQGGWGSQFGDEGGGFWIGCEAIRSALRSADSNPESDFAKRIASSLGLGHIGDVVAAWTKRDIGVPEVAAVFPDVLAMYPADPAKRILTDAAAHLRSLVESAETQIRVGNCRKSVIGSVARHPVMRQLIGLSFEEPLKPPEWGAILLAQLPRSLRRFW